MRYSLILAAMLAGSLQPALADEPAAFKWTSAQFAKVAGGNAKLGEELADKYRCAKCHNDDGVSDDEEVPSIAGQRATYLYKQLVDFKGGVRENKDMEKALRKVEQEDFAHLAAFYQQQERPPMVGGEPMLVMKVCDSCHNEEIVEKDDNVEVAPILKGQIRLYLQETMQAFKQQDRSNDLFVRMQSVSHKLTDQEIARLATYYGAVDPQ